jgi:RNA-binding protein NOB1
VVDAGAFIRGAPLQDLSENVYTIDEVVNEIRDKATLQRLQCLPYDLVRKDPPPEDIRTVIGFSKKTGDFGSLSSVDIKLIGLAYYLEKLHVGIEHLNKEPVRGKVVEKQKNEIVSKLAGFHAPKKTMCGKENEDKVDDGLDESEAAEDAVVDDLDEDDDSDWITPENVADVKKEFNGLSLGDEEAARPKVALITTDFAVQNVVLQMGLKLIAVDGGHLIRKTKQFVLRCHACFKITNDMNRKFCPSCGNLRTLKRVAVSVNESGEKIIHINFHKPINVRGTRYPLPAPKGGKHSNNPVLVEDQPIPQHKASKFAVTEKKVAANSILTDPDYIIRHNPFALNDVYSRASRHANLPGKANNFVATKRNPNAVRKPTGNRKKSNSNDV